MHCSCPSNSTQDWTVRLMRENPICMLACAYPDPEIGIPCDSQFATSRSWAGPGNTRSRCPLRGSTRSLLMNRSRQSSSFDLRPFSLPNHPMTKKTYIKQRGTQGRVNEVRAYIIVMPTFERTRCAFPHSACFRQNRLEQAIMTDYAHL